MIRRIYGDRGGHCKFSLQEWYISSDSYTPTLTTLVEKEILIVI